MKEAEDFVEKLNLHGHKFSNISICGILTNVYDFARTIWQSPMLYKYVDHGIDHSFAVLEKAIDIFEKLAPEDAGLSHLERLVLGLGVLVHDIGMQYNKYPSKEGKKDSEDVRKNHPELGFEMIKDVREGIFETLRSGPPLSLEEHHKMFLHYGAVIGFAHSGTKYWTLLRESTYDPRKEGGLQTIRFRPLAALIRLADELHCEYTRVPEINWIDSSLLTPSGKAHWTACYYTQDVKITSPGTAGLRIILNWRVPEDVSEDEVNLYRTLLQDLRERKINEEMEGVKEYFSFEENSEPCFMEFKLAPIPQQLPIRTLPEEVKKYITGSLRPYQYGLKSPPSYKKIRELINSPKLDDLKYLAQTFYLTGIGTQSGHFRLKTGWHTNKYLNCRALCSNQTFTHDLCQELAAFYLKDKITDVLSIGTTAIRIGSFLAFLLDARFSFTFGKVNIKSKYFGNSHYTDYELKLATFDGGRILIIDDILGVGSVANEILHQLKELPSQPEYVKIFTIFRLGDVEKIRDISDAVEIEYLRWFPDVEYYQEDPKSGTCEICKKNPDRLTIEE